LRYGRCVFGVEGKIMVKYDVCAVQNAMLVGATKLASTIAISSKKHGNELR